MSRLAPTKFNPAPPATQERSITRPPLPLLKSRTSPDLAFGGTRPSSRSAGRPRSRHTTAAASSAAENPETTTTRSPPSLEPSIFARAKVRLCGGVRGVLPRFVPAVLAVAVAETVFVRVVLGVFFLLSALGVLRLPVGGHERLVDRVRELPQQPDRAQRGRGAFAAYPLADDFRAFLVQSPLRGRQRTEHDHLRLRGQVSGVHGRLAS
eukprot:31176-Pelagococcus_subviridis.AAC.33